MGKKDIMSNLVGRHDKDTANAILEYALSDYADFLTEIAKDIYDSCIAQFYDDYTPRIYDRHGDINGKNLYLANKIKYSDLAVHLTLNPDELLPYYKMKKLSEDEYEAGEFESEDKRAQVLASVLLGIRARKSPRTPPWFPMTWRASYPNRFSKYSDWYSGCKTMNAIFDDFCETAVDDTIDEFWKILDSYI